MHELDLQYKVSNWHQLIGCQSNNSRELHINVTDFIQNEILTGTRISVNHDRFGCLFSTVLRCNGSLVTCNNLEVSTDIDPGTILSELRKYGFYVNYDPVDKLPGDQVNYLMTIRDLGFDKLRLLDVWHIENGVKVFETFVVVFNISENVQWLNSGYSPSRTEFNRSLENGTAMNLTNISNTKKYRWDWLYNWVANIDDIISDNEGTSLE